MVCERVAFSVQSAVPPPRNCEGVVKFFRKFAACGGAVVAGRFMASAEGEESETQPLTPNRGEERGAGWSESSVLKYGSLGLVIVQNSSHVLLLRYSRVAGGECEGYVARRAASAGPAAAAAAASPAQPQSEFTAAQRVSALPRLCARSLRSCALSL